MSNRRYEEFIKAIIHQTKENNITWNYLDSNMKLCENMNWTKETSNFSLFSMQTEKTTIDFNGEDSFYTSVDNTYVVIYVYENQPANLYVIPNTYKKVVCLTADEYGEYITRLLNLVQNQFPDGERFIDNILSHYPTKKNTMSASIHYVKKEDDETN